jgi:hypothetical protein
MVVELRKTAFYDIQITPSHLILTHHRVIVPTSNMLFLHQKSTGNTLSFLYASFYVICHSYRIFATTDNPPVSVRVSKHRVKHKNSWLSCRMKTGLVALYQERRNWLRRMQPAHIPPSRFRSSSFPRSSFFFIVVVGEVGKKSKVCCK